MEVQPLPSACIRPLQIGTLTLEQNLVMAPMSGITSPPFRIQAKRGGCALSFSEMVSADGLVYEGRKTLALCRLLPQEGPTAIQIFGSDPQVLARAARMAEAAGAVLVDINMGCPARRVCRRGSGASLMLEPRRIEAILRAVRPALSLPLTVKIRSGWDAARINAPEIAAIAEQCGVDAVTVHPRTRARGFTGEADWTIIARVKERVGVPVIGNGDVRSAADAGRMVRETGCDGIMIGRAALSRPWIFNEILAHMAGNPIPPEPTPAEKRSLILDHLATAIEFYGESIAVRSFRKHLAWYTKGLHGSTKFRHEAFEIAGAGELRRAIDDYFGLLERGT